MKNFPICLARSMSCLDCRWYGLRWLLLSIALLFFSVTMVPELNAQSTAAEDEKPLIQLSDDVSNTVKQQAAKIKADLEDQARTVFARRPLEWNLETIKFLYQSVIALPSELPLVLRALVDQSQILGAAGSVVVLILVLALAYSLFGQKRVLARITLLMQPLIQKLPAICEPVVLAMFRIVGTALIPLLLLGLFYLIRAMLPIEAGWFKYTGSLLGLWAIGVLAIGLLRAVLTQNLISIDPAHGKVLFRWTRMIVIFALTSMAVLWAAEIFNLRSDVTALIRFLLTTILVLALFLLHLNKRAFLSILPDLPYRVYQRFVQFLDRYYYLLIIVALATAMLWCVGYRDLGRIIIVKIWSTALAFILIMSLYHFVLGRINRWSATTKPSDEAAQFLIKSSKSLSLYATALAVVIVGLNLLELLNPLYRLMSFTLVKVGGEPLTPWTIVNALLILVAFVFVSRLIQAYLDYKVYPAFGIDPGLGYALNTSFKYTSWLLGFLLALKVVGLNLRFLLVFAGAIGLGVGLGLQSMAANIISGFTIIFGGKIRKGDWIEVDDTLGVVTDIFLRATKIRTRDNIEYLIPNSELISNTVVNFSLSSPMIRIALDVGVSYDADPTRVAQILETAAVGEPMVEKYRPPEVRLVAYGDNSVDFQLLIWIDVRKTARRKVRSALYFNIFDALKQAGIGIPYPQRDIHIVSGPPAPAIEPQA